MAARRRATSRCRQAAAPTSPSASSFPDAVGKRFGAIVDSIGATPAELVVERAMYNDAGGVTWAAGSNVVGTRLR